MFSLGILCSGNLGFETLVKIIKEYNISFILTDKNSLEIIKLSEDNKIPCFVGNPRKGKGYNFIKDFEADVIVSINYLFLINEDIINHSNLLTFNIHGSLLPKYRGRTPHVWAIINGERKTGITAHLIDSGCDTGKIIDQILVLISENDTGADVLIKFKELYYPLIKKILKKLESNSIKFIVQNNNNATYFGKRTPKDGNINWNWEKERIKNWVRAQAYPYPGAFTYYNKEKIIIDKVSYCNYENDHFKNGEVVETVPKIIVKVENGFLTLDAIRNKKINFIKGIKFKELIN